MLLYGIFEFFFINKVDNMGIIFVNFIELKQLIVKITV